LVLRVELTWRGTVSPSDLLTRLPTDNFTSVSAQETKMGHPQRLA